MLTHLFFVRKFDVKHFNKLLKYAMNRVLQDPNVSNTFALISLFRIISRTMTNTKWRRLNSCCIFQFLPEKQVISFLFYYFFFLLYLIFKQLQQFQFPVNKTQNPGYGDVIVNPINLSKIENNIDNLVYTNSESFLSDIKWILHNCSIYFSGEHCSSSTTI